MKRINISSNTEWENQVGYSRAVCIGPLIEIAGTTAVDKGKVIGIGDAYQQTLFILQKIELTLFDAGSSLNEVIRTRIYVTDINQWQAVGQAHQQVFGSIKPVTTMIEVAKLIDPKLLVEIEVTAYSSE